MKIAGSAIEGGHFSNHYSPDDRRPEVVAWVKKYKEKHGQVPDALGTLAYDGTNLLLEAIRKAGSDDPKKIREALASIRDFHGGHRKVHARPERRQRQERRDREDRWGAAEIREDGEPIGVKP